MQQNNSYLITYMLIFALVLTVPYVLAYNELSFPKKYFLQNNHAAGQKIAELEGGNRNFYVITDYGNYLAWPLFLKTVGHNEGALFRFITGYSYHDDMTSEQVYKMLKRAQVKYVIRFAQDVMHWQTFFEKVENQPEYFELIWTGESDTGRLIKLWRLN